LTGRAPAVLDPLLAHPARVELLDPTPAVARAAVRGTAAATALPQVRVEDMVLAVNEAVTNATCHGRPPARLRIWTALELNSVGGSDARADLPYGARGR
jgi:hypothetical protein